MDGLSGGLTGVIIGFLIALLVLSAIIMYEGGKKKEWLWFAFGVAIGVTPVTVFGFVLFW